MANLAIEDLNGDLFNGTAEGENLSSSPENIVWVNHADSCSAKPGTVVALTNENLRGIVRVNAHRVRAADATLTAADAFKIGYIRALLINRGYVSSKYDPAAYHVRYTEVHIPADWAATVQAAEAAAYTEAAMNAALTTAVKTFLRSNLMNMICMVAYVFRVRGHHYLDTYEELYKRLWEKCQYRIEEKPLEFKVMARHAFHAIYPVILDGIWQDAVENSHCNGALAKRFDTIPAGSAGPVVVHRGIMDLIAVFPVLQLKFRGELDYLEKFRSVITKDRWVGSVNCAYYGKKRARFDESVVAAMAATVKAALDNFAANAPLGESPALKRIADQAPLAGAILARSIRAAVDASGGAFLEPGKGKKTIEEPVVEEPGE